MTDNEVIKALEEMADYPHYYEESQILKSTIDIINRLKDNERKYRGKVQTQRYEINCNQKNIEKYKGIIKILEKDVAIAKSEAVKECLAKVKNYIKTHCNPYGKPDFDYDTSIKILNFVDKLAKEMVGDNNA